MDTTLVSFFANAVKLLFPDFEFQWLATEMRLSLPQELDFVNEANNANQVRDNFRNTDYVKIPSVLWSSRRILVMEYIEGAKIDNLEYMKKNSISPSRLSIDFTKMYSEMIFLHG